jgi:flagellin-like hook-associated protein FlgL
MTVSVNNCNSIPIQQALSNSLVGAAAAATKMATGEQFQHFFEDPTSNAIGLNMRSDLGVLKTVLKGIEQSTSMLFIAEAGAKAIYHTVNKMKEILTQAKLGYMTNDLIQTTLSPTYVQLKAEINRIADSVNFNGQTLINGQGGVKNAGTASSASANASYIPSSSSTVTLAPIAPTTPILNGLSATTVTGGTAGTITFATGASAVTPQITGGTITTDAAGNVNITGATIILNQITVSDSAATANTGTGNLTINDVDLKFAAGSYTFANGTITSTAAPTITNSTGSLVASDYSFVSTGGTITAVSGFSGTPALGASVLATGATVTGLTQTYNLSGGIGANSAFTFVTGTDLNTEIITFDLPNMRLNSSDGVLGMINTINTPANILSAAPTDLTNLNNSQDADTDIPLVEALLVNIIAQLDQIGAYEIRLINVQLQLQSDVQQVDQAQGVFMNADLAQQTENFTAANVKTNIAISCLKNLNNSLQSLQNLVS